MPDMPVERGEPHGLTGSRCLCRSCGETFSGESPFDMHRTGRFEDGSDPRRCLTRDEMAERRMVLDEAGVWRSPGSSGRLRVPPRRPIPGPSDVQGAI